MGRISTFQTTTVTATRYLFFFNFFLEAVLALDNAFQTHEEVAH